VISFKTSEFFCVCSVLELSITAQYALDAILLYFIAINTQHFKIFERLWINNIMKDLDIIDTINRMHT